MSSHARCSVPRWPGLSLRHGVREAPRGRRLAALGRQGGRGSGRAAREWMERGRCGWKGGELTGLGGAWGPSGGHSTPSPAAPARAGVSVSTCPRPRVGLLRPWPGPGEMHYINVNFPSSWAPSFNKLSARHCQSNFSHSVSLFSVWGNPVSLGCGRLAAGKVQLCRDADRPT